MAFNMRAAEARLRFSQWVKRRKYNVALTMEEPLSYFMTYVLLEGFFVYLFILILAQDPIDFDDSVVAVVFIMFVLLIQTVNVRELRTSADYVLFLARLAASPEIRDYSSVTSKKRLIVGHLQGIIRIGNRMSGGDFAQIALVQQELESGDSQGSLTLADMISAICLGITSRVSEIPWKERHRPFSEYYDSVKPILEAEDGLTASVLAEFLAKQYTSLPESIRKRNKAPEGARNPLLRKIEGYPVIVGIVVKIFLAFIGILALVYLGGIPFSV